MEQLKQIIAKNLTNYRKQASFTQQELASKLNYSDKAISKWERAEGTPDIFVLKALADLYGITVNDLITERKKLKKPAKSIFAKRWLVTALSAGLVWLVATIVMVVFLWIDPQLNVAKYAYISALPVCSIVVLVFACVWGSLWQRCACVSLLIWTLCVLVNVCFSIQKSWLIYIIGAVLQLLVILWFLLKFFIWKDKKQQ